MSEFFLCPLTRERMVDPVLAADGHSYERTAITDWLATHDTSPTTNTALEHRRLTPNVQLRRAIEAWFDLQSMRLQPHEVAIDRARPLGAGSFGHVYEGLFTATGTTPVPVAVKIIAAATVVEQADAAFLREVVALQRASAKCLHVTKFYGHYVHGGHLHLVMKRYTRSLLDVIRASPGGRLPETMAVHYAIQLFAALVELQEARIVSRDVKPENILLDELGRVFLADLGIAHIMQTTLQHYAPSNIAGTCAYMCAEMFDPKERGGISYPADVWAAGCVLLQMITGRPPFAGAHHMAIMFAVTSGHAPEIDATMVSAPLQELLRRCFAIEQAARPRAAEVVPMLHEYLQTLQRGGACNCNAAVGGPFVPPEATAGSGSGAAVGQQETVVMPACTEAAQVVERGSLSLESLRVNATVHVAGAKNAPAWTFVDCPGSPLLSTPELTNAFADMFPVGRAPSQLRLLIARDGGIDVQSFKAAMHNVDGGVLALIRTATNFLFGAVIFDRGHVLSDASGGMRWAAGDRDNFLFRLAGAGHAPTKLIVSAGQFEEWGLWLGQAEVGLQVGFGDLHTFCVDGTTLNVCSPAVFTTIAPGYPQGQVTAETLAGAQRWLPRRSEVYAITTPHHDVLGID